jgi:hypothetical protein
MGQKENKIIKEFLIDCPSGMRVFRVNSGMAWTGKITGKSKTEIVLKNPRPFWGMPEGTPDIIGWMSCTVTPDMVGQKIAVFYAREIKTCRTATTEEQSNFLKKLNEMGGDGEIIRIN